MEVIKKKKRDDAHPYIPELKGLYRAGRITRREFLRNATLLGMSLVSAKSFLVAFAGGDDAMTTLVSKGKASAEALGLTAVKAASPKRGGTLRVASQVRAVAHPANLSWVSSSNQLRQVAEYLTYTDGNNISYPCLLESWEASGDLKTWTLNLRQGIKFNNGDEFNADDVIFTIGEWFRSGSNMAGLMHYLSPGNVEKVGDYMVRLYLDTAEIAVPEHLSYYPALMLNHRTFEGDFISAPHGTGPYTLEEFSEGERVSLRRREDYWQEGTDGRPLPYLDAMEFIDMGWETQAWIAAIQADEVDFLDLSDIGGTTDVYLALKDDPNIIVMSVPTANTSVLRMRVDVAPWTDNRVRQALKLCQDREKILNMAHFGEGLRGHDFHVAPTHPEYCEKPIPTYDPNRARQLLANSGYPNGLRVELAVGTGWSDVVSYAEVLKEDVVAGGFNITLNKMPNYEYWGMWTEVDLGITPWGHQPLGTGVLNLAYTGDSQGNPTPWNETRWVDEEFDDLLKKANATLDVEARRKIMCDLQRIQQERGSIGIAWWRNVWFVISKKFQNVNGHPTLYQLFNEVWYDSEA